MGVIHDDAVTNVNRKTLARETSELQTEQLDSLAMPTYRGQQRLAGVDIKNLACVQSPKRSSHWPLSPMASRLNNWPPVCEASKAEPWPNTILARLPTLPSSTARYQNARCTAYLARKSP